MIRLTNLRPDDDPLPRATAVGPGSAYRPVEAAVLVEPNDIREVAATEGVGSRRLEVLRSWRLRPDPDDVGIDQGWAVEPLDGWRPVTIPHCWSRAEDDLADHRAPVFYARDVTLPETGRHQARFDGLDYVATVMLDGQVLGHHEGGFTPTAFDLPTGRTVRLTVRLDDPVEEGMLGDAALYAAKRKVKGVQEFHDSRPGGGVYGLFWTPKWARRWGSGGMVDLAQVVTTGDVRLEATFVTATSDRFAVNWTLTNLTGEPVDAVIRAVITPQQAVAEDHGRVGVTLRATLPPGPSRVAVVGDASGFAPWAPVGDPAEVATRYELASEVVLADGDVSDRDRVSFGVRDVRMSVSGEDRYQLHLDDERVYVKGTNYIPGVWMPELTQATFRRDLSAVVSAHLNSVGPHALALPERFYDVADELGVLVYQDFPLNLGHDPDGPPLFDGGPTMAEASLLLAAEFTYRLYNHPSVVYWCGHNEPGYQLAEVFSGSDAPQVVEAQRQMAAMPDESKLDRQRAEMWRHVDPTRPAYPASGLGRLRDEGDTHSYKGSLGGDPTTAVTENSFPFLSEFGAWTPDFCVAEAAPWARGDWPPDPMEIAEDLEQRTDFYVFHSMHAGRPDRYPDAATWTYATQLWAAMFTKLGVEAFRRRRWDPCGGHRYHLFVDHWGHAGAGVLDRYRNPQLTYWALAAAHRPLLPVAEAPSSMRVVPGEPVHLRTWLVCDDLRTILDQAAGSDAPDRVRLSWQLSRLPEDQRAVIGVDDPQMHHPFGTVAPPVGDLVVVPFGTGEPVVAGEEQVTLDADGVSAGPRLTLPVEAGDPTAYLLTLRAEVAGQVSENWQAFVAAPEGWEPRPGMDPVRQFSLEVCGAPGPVHLLRRWTGAEVTAGSGSEVTFTGLAPDQYLVESGGRVTPLDLYGDVRLDLASGTAAAVGTPPWSFDPLASNTW